MSDILYIQTDRNRTVTSEKVTLGDVAELYSPDSAVLARSQARRIATLPKGRYGRYVCSMIDIIREIEKEEEHVDITHIGEPSFVLTYENPKKPGTAAGWAKTVLVSLITFFGTAFSIMTFNTDAGVRDLFDHLYALLAPGHAGGFSVLELTYSIGVGLGVVLYFNHFGRRKLTEDPTPLEVEMRTYEDDVDSTVIEQCSRAGKGGTGCAVSAGDHTRNHRS